MQKIHEYVRIYVCEISSETLLEEKELSRAFKTHWMEFVYIHKIIRLTYPY